MLCENLSVQIYIFCEKLKNLSHTMVIELESLQTGPRNTPRCKILTTNIDIYKVQVYTCYAMYFITYLLLRVRKVLMLVNYLYFKFCTVHTPQN